MIQVIISEVQLTQPDCVIGFTNDIDVEVFADKNRIGQVLINLLINAIKYSPLNRNIHVVSKITLNGVVVTVTDTGIGITNDDQ